MAKATDLAYNFADLRELARGRLPRGLFEFVDRGTEDEVSLRNTRAVFERIRLRPRTLVVVSGRSREVTLFGEKHRMPLVIAPGFLEQAAEAPRPGLRLLETARAAEK